MLKEGDRVLYETVGVCQVKGVSTQEFLKKDKLNLKHMMQSMVRLKKKNVVLQLIQLTLNIRLLLVTTLT